MPISEDTVIFPPGMQEALAVPMDVAADEACEKLGLPLLGGPSGRGWSFMSVAQACPHLWEQTYGAHGERDGKERTKPAPELQIGGLFHLLLALYYGYGLSGTGDAFYHRRGLLAPDLHDRLGKRGKKTARDWVKIGETAADSLLAFLKGRADGGETAKAIWDGLNAATGVNIIPEAKPSLNIILETERLFDAHTNNYGNGREDVTPLAVEWFAEHPALGYTCRYDMIVRLGKDDPFVQSGQLKSGATVVIEHKSAKWLSDWAQESWFLDGEILGQLLLWGPSGCDTVFGPLAGVIVDITTKEKTPKFSRILVPPNLGTLAAFEKMIRFQQAEIALWKATGYFPRRLTSCWRFGRPCGLLQSCRASAVEESMDLMRGAINVDEG